MLNLRYSNLIILYFIYTTLCQVSIHGAELNQEISNSKFQLNFLEKLIDFSNKSSLEYLNTYLHSLNPQLVSSLNKNLLIEFQEAKDTDNLDQKIAFIRKYVDVSNDGKGEAHLEQVYILRNMHFLQNTQTKLKEMLEESKNESQLVHQYHVCRQFLINSTATEPTIQIEDRPESNTPQSFFTADLETFGKKLYDLINVKGAGIIDEFLIKLRSHLEYIMDKNAVNTANMAASDNTDNMDNTDNADNKDNKVLKEIVEMINDIVNLHDLHAKRQQLYNAVSILSQEYKLQHIIGEFAKYKKYIGFDCIFEYLLVNFEFLENLYEQWEKLLPKTPLGHMDENGQLLHNILMTYNKFKLTRDSEVYQMYEENIEKLQNKTIHLKHEVPLYYMLYNSTNSFGPISLHAIMTNCRETYL
ncbi:uncharacterized protein LOC119688552 [Teleopsis dalmanni]|uniref:uncharacterized protein LOC119688552 n=1 Tax=Teleopsis dalmanni TaxID=139649 RepID=UPI0018CDDED8|nr:uncharacterized protein LOC119688552 [Teleopsis dalmanni]